jgi:hypothetical protein
VLAGLAIVVGVATASRAFAAPAPARADGDLPPADPPDSTGEAPPPALEPVAPVPASDDEASRAQPDATPQIQLPPQAAGAHRPWLRHPGNAVTFDLGFFYGGADFASAVDANGNTVGTLSLGSGVLFTIGGIVTPLWIGDSVGFGLGAFAGVKADSLSGDNGSVWMSRFPVGAALHVLLDINLRWWLFFRGGFQKELDINISGDATLTAGAHPQGSLGSFGEGGVYLIAPIGENHTAFVLTFRYGTARDTIGATSLDANSGGIIVAVHYNFL